MGPGDPVLTARAPWGDRSGGCYVGTSVLPAHVQRRQGKQSGLVNRRAVRRPPRPEPHAPETPWAVAGEVFLQPRRTPPKPPQTLPPRPPRWPRPAPTAAAAEPGRGRRAVRPAEKGPGSRPRPQQNPTRPGWGRPAPPERERERSCQQRGPETRLPEGRGGINVRTSLKGRRRRRHACPSSRRTQPWSSEHRPPSARPQAVTAVDETKHT